MYHYTLNSYFSVPVLKHYKIFLPGYHLHQCMAVHPTHDGLPNLEGFTKEHIIDKIEHVKRLCTKVEILVDYVNSELYAMHIPSDAYYAWKTLWDVHRICMKLCRKYTEFEIDSIDSAMNDSLQCVREVKIMLTHLSFCSLYNPRENITAASLHVMLRLLNSYGHKMEAFLHHIENTHRHVEAE